MFGPDICGQETKKVQLIFYYKEKYHANKYNISCEVVSSYNNIEANFVCKFRMMEEATYTPWLCIQIRLIK